MHSDLGSKSLRSCPLYPPLPPPGQQGARCACRHILVLRRKNNKPCTASQAEVDGVWSHRPLSRPPRPPAERALHVCLQRQNYQPRASRQPNHPNRFPSEQANHFTKPRAVLKPSDTELTILLWLIAINAPHTTLCAWPTPPCRQPNSPSDPTLPHRISHHKATRGQSHRSTGRPDGGALHVGELALHQMHHTSYWEYKTAL